MALHKTDIYHHLDKNGIRGMCYVSMGMTVDVKDGDTEDNFTKVFRVSSNPFGLTDSEYENIILDYIFDTTNIKIKTLSNIDRYSSIDGLPFIIEIFKDKEYQAIFTLAFKTIDGTICLNESDKISSLGNIEQINGDLKLRGSSIESLGRLREVKGSIYVRQFDTPFTKLNSLENLEYVGGDLILKSTPILDLGKLKSVGGTLNLRKTKVENLGTLESVGQDLFLPKEMKNIVDTSRIKVNGNIKYFNN